MPLVSTTREEIWICWRTIIMNSEDSEEANGARTEFDKMLLGLPYDAMQDMNLVRQRLRARKYLTAYNVSWMSMLTSNIGLSDRTELPCSRSWGIGAHQSSRLLRARRTDWDTLKSFSDPYGEGETACNRAAVLLRLWNEHRVQRGILQ